jgi:hypothetical protein
MPGVKNLSDSACKGLGGHVSKQNTDGILSSDHFLYDLSYWIPREKLSHNYDSWPILPPDTLWHKEWMTFEG